MPKLVKMETSMVVDNGGPGGIAYQHGDHVMIEDADEADRWIEKGAASEADDGAKAKHHYPPKQRKPAPAPEAEGKAKPKGKDAK